MLRKGHPVLLQMCLDSGLAPAVPEVASMNFENTLDRHSHFGMRGYVQRPHRYLQRSFVASKY